MKKIALLAALTLAVPAWSQDAKPPASEPAKPAPVAQEAPKAEAPKAEAPKPRAHRKANPRRQEDARHCLEKENNTEIIKCAEAYL
jgi:predicted flap endonuclease-1-like 5' DNA nuclease